MSRLKSFMISCICDALLTADRIFKLLKFRNNSDGLVLLALMFVGGLGLSSTFPLDSSRIATMTLFDETRLRGRNGSIPDGRVHNNRKSISMSELYKFHGNLKRYRDSRSVWSV